MLLFLSPKNEIILELEYLGKAQFRRTTIVSFKLGKIVIDKGRF